MAQFCTKCGSPMGEGMQFCTTCGAVVGASPAAAPIATPASAVPPTPVELGTPAPPVVGVTPTPPAQKSGSPVMKIILIIVGVIVLLGMLGIGSCIYVAYRAKQKMHQFEREMKSTFPSGMGTPRVQMPGENPSEEPGAGPAVDMGDLAYPGATLGQSANQSLFGAAGMKMQEYFTNDSVDAVVSYYRNKLGNNAMVNQSGGNAVVQVGGGGAFTTIAIAADGSSGKTKITVSSIHKQ